MLKKILILAGLSLLTACSAGANISAKKSTAINTTQDQQILAQSLKTNRPHNYSNQAMSPKLAKMYQEWAGTHYRLGGSSKFGIDCSAFTQTTFAKVFGVSLPRSTSEQRYVGKQINKSELQQGDLVFFRRNHHVGVYIGNNKFMHASTSKGVTIDSLNDHYWSRTYSQSRRVL